jgi:hypothetical protein
MDTSSSAHNLVVDGYDPVPVSLDYDSVPVFLANLGLALASVARSYIPECRCPLPHYEALMEQIV